MSTKTVVTLIDDLSGDEDEDVQTKEFWVDGEGYEIDLGTDNRQDFDDFMQTYIAAARKLPKRAAPNSPRTGKRRGVTGSGPARRDRAQTQAVRDWARSHGYEVSDRGRIPAHVEEAYNTGTPAPEAAGGEEPESQGSYLAAV